MRIPCNRPVLYVLLSLLVLTGCATAPPVPDPAEPDEPEEEAPQEAEPAPEPEPPFRVRRELPETLRALPVDVTAPYDELAEYLPRDLQQREHDWLVEAPHTVNGYTITLARIFHVRGEYEKAAQLLSLVRQDDLSPEEQALLIRIAPVNELALNRPAAALAWLSSPDYQRTRDRLTLPQQTRLLYAEAQAHTLSGQAVEAIRARSVLHPFLESEEQEQQANAEAIWVQVLSLSPTARDRAMSATRNPEVLGWLDLGRVFRSGLSGDRLETGLSRWSDRHGNHPAMDNLPESFRQAMDSPSSVPERVALLLPRSGPLAPQAQAIEDGFLAAWYGARNNGDPAPELLFLDARSNDIQAQIRAAGRAEVDLILGPLSLQNLYRVEAMSDLPAPVIALNRTDSDLIGNPDLLQFGLSPFDEVDQLASQAWQSGLRRAAILAPQTTLGQDLADRFSRNWRNQGGRVVNRVGIPEEDNGREYLARVKSLLNIDHSEARAWEIRSLLDAEVVTEPRRRDDIDFIFMPVNATQGRTLKPLLNFQFAGDIPVLALSDIIAPGEPERNADMAGIRALEIPWRLSEWPLRSRLADTLPEYRMSLDRSYALGADLFSLLAHRPIWETRPEIPLAGATGQLTLGDQGSVRHRFEWARIEADGIRHLAPEQP